MQSVTLLDGGMGQELVRRSGVDPTPQWSGRIMQDNPALVRTLHEDFIKAGADVITINSYSVTPERLARDGDASLFKTLQSAACQAALQARDNVARSDVRVAGCLPPLVASYRPDLMPPIEQTVYTYQQIVEAQLASVDLFICETMGSIKEAVAAGTAAVQSGKPVWVALTLDDSSHACLRSGESLVDAIAALNDIDIAAVLLNCSRPETISASWSTFEENVALPTGAYANGFTSVESLAPGGTVNALEARQDFGPEQYAAFAMDWVQQGASIIGGCCEVGPEHIAHLRALLDAPSTV